MLVWTEFAVDWMRFRSDINNSVPLLNNYDTETRCIPDKEEGRGKKRSAVLPF